RAIVQVRGQSTFTDGFGGFVLRNVPVMAGSGDQVTVEVSYMRPDGSIARTDEAGVEITAGALTTIGGDIVLDVTSVNRPPVILAPTSLSIDEGQSRGFDLVATDPDSGQTVQVALSGGSFASLLNQGNDVYTLHVAPGANTAGSYTLRLTASDNLGQSSSYDIGLTVNRTNPNTPAAQTQSVKTDEDAPMAITLTGSDPGNHPLSYTIVSAPLHGSLSGGLPNLTYTPAELYKGADSFTFKVNNGTTASHGATVFIAIRPINHAPILTIPGAQTGDAGQTLSFIISASDMDAGQALSLTATGLPPSASLAPVGAASYQFSWTPTE